MKSRFNILLDLCLNLLLIAGLYAVLALFFQVIVFVSTQSPTVMADANFVSVILKIKRITLIAAAVGSAWWSLFAVVIASKRLRKEFLVVNTEPV